MRNLYATICIIIALNISAFTQNTVGLISHDLSQVMDGYILNFPLTQANVYLLDNCGQYVHMWEDSSLYVPGATAMLMDDGRLVKCKRSTDVSSDPIWAGGGGAIVEIRSWENDLLWTFELNDSTARLHHDIALNPNGNIFMVAWEAMSKPNAIAAGRDTSLFEQDYIWPDYIIEVKPIGTDSFEIVWEWHAIDHLIQDYDSTKANYGVVKDHPELIDFNYSDAGGDPDWMHVNGIDYNHLLDQIILSVPTFNEVWVIDKSTTTAEAASHAGGLSGRGGDLIYRWGNPEAYRQGDSTDQQLSFQHDIHWIDRHLNASSHDFGKLMVFNNRYTDSSSLVGIFAPVFDPYDWEYPMTGNLWGPATFEWKYQGTPPSDFHSTITSSAQRLKNGNTIICAGRPGYTFEINPSKEIVWEYINPFNGATPATQGDILGPGSNLQFKVNKYPANFAGFAGKDLTPKGYIEFSPDTAFCEIMASIENVISTDLVTIYPNPAQNVINLEFAKTKEADIMIFDGLGRLVFDRKMQTNQSIPTDNWNEGMYFINFEGKIAGKVVIMR